jgi:hypothetical protein
MSDNFQYVDMCKNLPENLATTGLYRNNSAFYLLYRIISVLFGRKLQIYFCVLICTKNKTDKGERR